MSSDTVARAHAFATKADELALKGHLLRAAENYGRAAEVARALGADNLVTLRMEMRQGAMFCAFSTNGAPEADPHICASHRASFIALLSGAVDALERRRVAGTLLDGKCSAAEEAWRALQWQTDAASNRCQLGEAVRV